MWLVLKLFAFSCIIAFAKDYYTFTTIDHRYYLILNNATTVAFGDKDIQPAKTWMFGSINGDLMSFDVTSVLNIMDMYTQGRLNVNRLSLWILCSPLKVTLWPFQLNDRMHLRLPIFHRLTHEMCYEKFNTSNFTIEQFEKCMKYK